MPMLASLSVAISFLCIGSLSLSGNRIGPLHFSSLFAIVACALIAASTSAWFIDRVYTRVGMSYLSYGAYIAIAASTSALLAMLISWFMKPLPTGEA